jgi:hypothetical protein
VRDDQFQDRLGLLAPRNRFQEWSPGVVSPMVKTISASSANAVAQANAVTAE